MLFYLVTSPNKPSEDKGYINKALIPITKNFIFQLRKVFKSPYGKECRKSYHNLSKNANVKIEVFNQSKMEKKLSNVILKTLSKT